MRKITLELTEEQARSVLNACGVLADALEETSDVVKKSVRKVHLKSAANLRAAATAIESQLSETDDADA